jgi:hypothetical protein
MSKRTKKQHINPRYLLARFAEDATAKRPQIWTWDKAAARIYKQSVLDAAQEHLFYDSPLIDAAVGVPQFTETKHLAGLDGHYAGYIDELLARIGQKGFVFAFQEQDRVALSSMCAHLLLRGRTTRALTNLLAENAGAMETGASLQARMLLDRHENASAALILVPERALLNVFLNANGRPYLMPDVAISLRIGRVNGKDCVQTSLPLSPRVLISAIWPILETLTPTSSQVAIEASATDVAEQQVLAVRNADRFVFAPEPQILDDLGTAIFQYRDERGARSNASQP